MIKSIFPQIDDYDPAACKHFGGVTTSVGKLPAMGLKPFMEVFRCDDCSLRGSGCPQATRVMHRKLPH